ncbi:glycosyltransferase [Anderseniella sp. Alg231-50]|uniref:glycosyltransferase n=1 Tax=Anderseniella sp. Alg231-50 TaxID=1922226 RepID=UPI00307C5F4A
MERWSRAEATNATFVRLSYERLTSSPEQTLRSLVNVFSPNLPCDEKKLASSIIGVREEREIRSFRFCDEELFQSLDQLTTPAYDKMAELPWLTRIDGPTKGPGATSVSEPNRREKSRQLFIDTTGALENAGNAHNGATRLQYFVARRALEDPNVEVVRYDRRIHTFRNLTVGEKILLDIGPQSGLTTKLFKSTSKPALQIAALCLAIKSCSIAIGFDHKDRKYAAKIANASFIMSGYFFVRRFIRAYHHKRRALDASKQRIKSISAEIDDLSNGILLMPDIVPFGSQDPDRMAANARYAFICNDLSAWRHSELVNDSMSEQRIDSRRTNRWESGALVLCPSDTSRAMLQELIDPSGSPNVQIGQFRPASLLLEKAQSLGRASRMKPKQPFILCNSTIEPRKNHLLLARVWKQAHDEGVALPKLVCVGKWGTGVDELRNYLGAHAYLRERIEFRGPVNDFELIDLYRSALFAVVPSFVEDCSNGASECLDFWLPVIVSTAPALTEAVQGLMPIVEPYDQDGWLAQIRRLSENSDELADLQDVFIDHYLSIEFQESWNSIKRPIVDYS